MASPVKQKNDLAKLVGRAKEGEQAAFSEIIQLTHKRLFRFLVFLSHDVTLANDLLQDTYLYALEHIKSLQEPDALYRWLFLVAKNRFLDHKKSPKNKAHQAIEDFSASVVIAGDRTLAVAANKALSQMPQEDKLLLLLVDLEGYAYSEAAEIIGISESAVRSRLHRAREAFGKFFNQK